MIRKKSYDEKKLIPKVEPTFSPEVMALTVDRRRKAAATAAAPATPARPARRASTTGSSAASPATGAAGAGAAAGAGGAAAAAPAAPPRPAKPGSLAAGAAAAAPEHEAEPEMVVFDPTRTPTLVGGWERMYDDTNKAYYYEHIHEATTQWEVPEVFLTWFADNVVNQSPPEAERRLRAAQSAIDAAAAAAVAAEVAAEQAAVRQFFSILVLFQRV